DPDAARGNTPQARAGFVVRDAVGRQEPAHVVRLVIGDVAQVEQQLRHARMIAGSRTRHALWPDRCVDGPSMEIGDSGPERLRAWRRTAPTGTAGCRWTTPPARPRPATRPCAAFRGRRHR